MKTVRVYRLAHLSPTLFCRLKAAQMEAAPVWTRCVDSHKQRMSLWEYGRDLDYLTHTSRQVHILSATSSERGKSLRCPGCGHKQKPKGRNRACRVCAFPDHRGLVGSINMHQDVCVIHLRVPRSFTYRRASLNQEL